MTKEPYIVFSLRKAANEPTAIARVTPHVGEDRRKIPVDVPGTPDRD